jgi:hypothetical protein
MIRVLLLSFIALPGSFAQSVPELMYYKFNVAGTTVLNEASSPVGTNPAPILGQTIGGTGQTGTALVGNGLTSTSNCVNTGWNPSLTGNWTISMWLNNIPSTTTLYYYFGTATNSFRCFIGGVAGANNIILRGTGVTDVLVSGITPGPSVVHFVYNGTDIKAYLNGALASTVAQGAISIVGTNVFKVGGYSSSASIPSGSLLDEFRMYNRALNAAEVALTWNLSLLGYPFPDMMYYRFDVAGTSVQNEAIVPVGTNPAPILGQTVGGSGLIGSALVGNGLTSTSNYVNTGWNTFLTGNWTIAMWVNNIPSTTTLYYYFGTETSSFRCFIGGVAGANNIILRGTGISDVLVSGITPGPSMIHFVYNGIDIKAYVNGALANTVAQGVISIVGTNVFKVGGYSTSNSIPSGSLMDEFRMYSRALGAAEIEATWDITLGTPPVGFSLPYVENFDASSGWPAYWTEGGDPDVWEISTSWPGSNPPTGNHVYSDYTPYPATGTVDSPIFDMTGVSDPWVTFYHYWRAEYSGASQDGFFQASFDGSTWYTIEEWHHLNPAVYEGTEEYKLNSYTWWKPLTTQVMFRWFVFHNNDWYWVWDDFGIQDGPYGQPGLWTGLFSTDWFLPDNWSDFSVPVAATNVVIPAGCPNYPVISGSAAVCDDIDINAGASLAIGNNSLTAGGIVDINGLLTMTNAAGVLNASSVYWNAGSTDNVTAGEIHCISHIFNEGTNAMLGTGNTVFVKSGIGNYDPDAEYGNLTATPVEKGSFEEKANYPVHIAGNFTIATGFSWSAGLDYFIGGTFDVQSGASFSMTGTNTVTINTTAFTLNGSLNIGSGHLLCHNGFSLASTGTLSISGGSLIMDKAYYDLDAWQYFYGTLNMSDGLLEMTHNSFNFYSGSVNNITGGTLRCGFTFSATTANNFQPTGGVVELVGSDASCYVQLGTGNYFNNLYVNRGSMIEIESDILVKGNVEIVAGPLRTVDISSIQHNMTVGGNWTNTGGSAAFDEGTGTVFFSGQGGVIQYVSAETFCNVTQLYNAPGSNLQFMGATMVTNWLLLHYFAFANSTLNATGLDISDPASKFTANSGGVVTIGTLSQGGTLVANSGTIDVLDLYEAGIFGTHKVAAGAINLTQDAAQYPDLNGTLNVSGGTFKMTGGDGTSWWSYAGNASVTLSGAGVIDFVGSGIYVYQNGTYTLTENVTGGTIRTNGSFYSNHPNFTPSGGVAELYGGADAITYAIGGSVFYNVLINKSGGDGSSYQYKDREGNLIEGGKANAVNLSGALAVANDLTVDEGTLNTLNYAASVAGNVAVNAGGILNIGSGGSLAMGDLKTLAVNNGGVMRVLGVSGTPATVTHISGYYNFNVESGGTLGGSYGIFESMNTNGIYIKAGALVDAANTFNKCMFREGKAAGRLLTIHNNQVFDVQDAVFPTNTWGGAYNVAKNVNVGTVNFINATGGFAGEAYEYDPYSRINWSTSGFMVDLKAYIQGPYNVGTGLMNTTINGVLPLAHPFHPALPYFGNPNPDWYYAGAEAVAAIPNANIVDWILLELRDAPSAATATSATMVARKACFLLRNGKVVDLDGASAVNFSVPITQGLYVVLWQRNHLGIMSSVALTKVGTTYSYNFSTAAGQAYLSGQKLLTAGVYGMYSGDGNGDGQVGNPDKLDVWTIQSGSAGYKEGDFNLSGQVDNVDKVEFWKPNSGTGSQIP